MQGTEHRPVLLELRDTLLHTEPNGNGLNYESQCHEDYANYGVRIIEVGTLAQSS